MKHRMLTQGRKEMVYLTGSSEPVRDIGAGSVPNTRTRVS